MSASSGYEARRVFTAEMRRRLGRQTPGFLERAVGDALERIYARGELRLPALPVAVPLPVARLCRRRRPRSSRRSVMRLTSVRGGSGSSGEMEISMSPDNARRIAERQERDRPKITVEEVETYRRVHFPEDAERVYPPGYTPPPPIPGDGFIAQLPHDRFHRWFGTECDDTCPHRRRLPVAEVVPRSWWRRLLRV